MHCRESRKCFLTKKRIVGSPESASRRKNALSGAPKVLPGEKTRKTRRRERFSGFFPKRNTASGFFVYFCGEKKYLVYNKKHIFL